MSPFFTAYNARMQIEPGKTLLHYRIDAKIGELQRQEAGRAAPGEGGAGVDEVSAVLDEFVKAGGSVVDGQTMEVN